ncbi:Translocation protein S66 [Teratosphaeriaceae sp. CCFEE 6253]|nr:Translocation protein S66 [Teratosphaeriaceae sp. CCFEE 6253]
MDNATNPSPDGTFYSSFNASSSSNSTFNGTSSAPPTGPPKPFWTNLLLPTLYLLIVLASLYAFSTTYRQRKLAKAAALAPWFPPHRARDVYLSLLHLDPGEQKGAASGGDGEVEKEQLSRVPDSVLKAALLQRALEDIKRIVQLRGAKPALQTLLQRGSVGDELWQRFLRAEQEMEAEVKDVVEEANAFAPQWGQTIFQSANEMNQNLLIKQRMVEIQEGLEAEKSWWETKRAGIQSDFMKEVAAEEKPAEISAANAPVPRKTGSSDEEAVIVEAGGPAQAQGSLRGKRKGKK